MFNFDFLLDDYFFSRPVKDMTPYKVIEKNGGLTIILNTLGISSEDIEVEAESANTNGNQYLKISGKTKDDITEKEYSINIKFSVSKLMKSIDWESKNGLTYLYVSFVDPVKQLVSINRK